MTKTSWVEICVSDLEQSIQWFEDVLGFRVTAREEDDADLREKHRNLRALREELGYTGL
jgi:catechol 2,3-dioxygenase-like lactoylglutathione lyase family enzyme